MGRKRRHNKHLPERMRLSRGSYYLTRYIHGKQKWINLGRDYASACSRYAQLENIDDRGIPDKRFSELANRFEIDCLPRYAANSQRSFRSWLKPLRAVFDPVPIADIRQMHAARYLDESRYKVSANRQISLLSVMLGEAVRWGWIDSNPLQKMRKNKEEERRRYITDEELKRLIDAADFQMARLIRIAYLTAMRKSDIVAIQWKNLKDDALFAVQQKTNTPIAFSLNGELGEIFDELRANRKVLSHYVFLNKHNTNISDRTVDTYWWEIRDKARVEDVVFHDIRRKRITDLTNTHGEAFAQAVAGHKDRKSTARYFTPDIIKIDLPG
ncbi:MAG: tyrosine-type recombinase/integrase [Woeseiaceae bacterium]